MGSGEFWLRYRKVFTILNPTEIKGAGNLNVLAVLTSGLSLSVNPQTDLQFSLKCSVHKVLTCAASEILNGNVRWPVCSVKHVLDIFWSLTFENVGRNNYRMKFPAFGGRSRETESSFTRIACIGLSPWKKPCASDNVSKHNF